MKENTKSGGQQQGSTEATTIIKAINLGDVQFSDATENYKDKIIRAEKEYTRKFQLMNQKVGKLQASIKK